MTNATQSPRDSPAVTRDDDVAAGQSAQSTGLDRIVCEAIPGQ